MFFFCSLAFLSHLYSSKTYFDLSFMRFSSNAGKSLAVLSHFGFYSGIFCPELRTVGEIIRKGKERQRRSNWKPHWTLTFPLLPVYYDGFLLCVHFTVLKTSRWRMAFTQLLRTLLVFGWASDHLPYPSSCSSLLLLWLTSVTLHLISLEITVHPSLMHMPVSLVSMEVYRALWLHREWIHRDTVRPWCLLVGQSLVTRTQQVKTLLTAVVVTAGLNIQVPGMRQT